MSPSQEPNQIRTLGVDPLINGFIGNRGKLWSGSTQSSGDQFWRPAFGQHLFDLMAQNPAFEPDSFVRVLSPPERSFISTMGPISLTATIAIKLSANRTRGAS